MRFVRAASGLIAGSLALATTPAIAEPIVVKAQSAPAYNVSKVLMRRGDGPLSAADAALFKRAILADTQVDATERVILDALMAGEPFAVQSHSSGSDVVFTRTASDEAKQALQAIQSFAYDDPILQKWMEGTAESVGSVIALYEGSAEERQQAIDALVKRADSVWKEDSWKDDYRKLKGEMASWSTRCNTQSGAAYRTCSTMVHEVMVKADRGLDGSTDGGIPDSVYSRFKPKED
jgi:hypothetical protein